MIGPEEIAALLVSNSDDVLVAREYREMPQGSHFALKMVIFN
jgi:hypothetical protein